MVVELAVNRGGVDGHVGVFFEHGVDAFGAGQQAQELDGLGLALFEARHSGGGGVAGGQHGVDHHDVALLHVFGHLEVVLHGLQRFGVAVQPDVAHTRARHHGQHAIQNAVARPQDAHKHQLLAVNHGRHHGLQRGLNLHLLRGHAARDLVGHQAGKLIEQTPEAAGAGVLLAHEGELVLHQGVVNEVDVGAGGGVNGCHK